MTPYELFDIALSVGTRIDVQWTLFISVHLALFGAIIYIDRPLRTLEKFGALTIYCLFAILNYRVMQVQIELLSSAYKDIAKIALDPCCINSDLLKQIIADVATHRLDTAEFFLVGGHVLMTVLVFISVYFDKALGSKFQSSERTEKTSERNG